MIRLRENTQNTNTAEDYNEIFLKRLLKKPDPYDIKRWKLLMKYFRGGKIIDLGCLDSQIPRLAKQNLSCIESWGLDQSQEPLDYLSRHSKGERYVRGNLYDTIFPNEYFNYVVLGEVIEHLERPQDAIKEAMRILEPGGWLAVSTPLGETEAGEVDRERHLWSFNMGDIIKLLKPYGKPKTKVIGSEKLPVYKYHFPVVIGWVKKI